MTNSHKGQTLFTDVHRRKTNLVADWQLAHPGKHPPAKWVHAAFYRGLIRWAQLTKNESYWTTLKAIANEIRWQPDRPLFHADSHAVGSLFVDLYKRYRDPQMIQGIQDRFDYILANRATAPLTEGRQEENKRWWWCDALFMAPPVLSALSQVTGDNKYLHFMNEEWWATTDLLYDREEHLYYRDARFFTIPEANGQKLFWSRGNGWVIAGLALTLENIPSTYADRPRYEQLFRELAERLITIQPADGLWRASLLDPASYPAPETSGTVFHTFGLAWGIRQGLLDPDRYRPHVQRAWHALLQLVHADGRLKYTQQIGGRPQPVEEGHAAPYGPGGFLLAATEIAQGALLN